ncbi:MAG: putative ABC transporter permease protein, partial [Anaerolineales bacterium]|nr:putative ABC transporter permease protein [Anaerolineales bacterium]
FGVLVIFGMNTLLPAFINAFQANAMALADQTDATITNKTGEAFSMDVAQTVANVEGVRAVSAKLERPLNLPADYFDNDPATPDRVTAVSLVGGDPDALRAMGFYNVDEGRFITADDEGVAVIAKSLADVAGVKLGDVLELPTPTGLVKLTIVGLLPQRLMPGNEEVLVPLAQAQKLLDMPGKINVIDANFDTTDEARRTQIEETLKTTLGSHYTIGVIQAGAEILTNIKNAQAIMTLLGTLGLLMGGFIIFNTFRTIVVERKHDIGMLRAIGANQNTILSLILVEGLVQGVVGTALGLLLGYGFGWLAVNAFTSVMRQFLNVNVGSPSVSIGLVALSIITLGVGVTLVAGLLPARAASHVTPLEALRPAVGDGPFRPLTTIGFWVGVVSLILAIVAILSGNAGFISLGAALFIAGLILIGPALVQPIARLFGLLLALAFARAGTAELAEGNLARQPSRAAVTAATTMIALAIVVMASSVISSASGTFIAMLKNSLSSDYLLIPPTIAVWGVNVGAAPKLADDLRAIDGVGVVSTLRFAATQINDVAVGVLGIEPVAYQATSGLTFLEGDQASAFAALSSGRNIIINGLLKSSANVNIGDEITLLTSTGEVQYKIVAVASDYLNAKTTTAYISQANIAADFGRTEDVMLQVNRAPGADVAQVEAGLKEALKPYPQFRLIVGQAYVDEYLKLFDSIFLGMYVLVVFLAVPSLIAMVNTLAIGVIERTREIGMLRAVGATRNQIRTIVLAESLILAAIGTAFGLLSGLYLGYMGVKAFAALGFPMDYSFSANGLILATAAGLLFGAFAAIIPARQAARMEIVQALRYE